MISRWSDEEAARFVAHYAQEWGEDLALRTYSSRLLGSNSALVLHGGGNSSVKADWINIFGERVAAIYVKASGMDMATIEPAGHPALDLEYLLRLWTVDELSDDEMVDQLRTHLLRSDGPNPSIEALVHAFLPAKFIDHTHADAILALTNRPGGDALAREVLGAEVIVLPYITPGFKLAKTSIEAFESHPEARGMVWGHHGLVTWGQTARESYETMVRLTNRAEEWLAAERVASPIVAGAPEVERARGRLAKVAPIIRGLLAEPSGDEDRPHRRVILQCVVTPEVLSALFLSDAEERFVSPVLTTDHLIRTKSLPLWVEGLDFDDPKSLKGKLTEAVAGYRQAYESYVEQHRSLLPAGIEPFDSAPRVILLPGAGAVCVGSDLEDAVIARDITEHTLAVKTMVDRYEGPPNEELFRMEYRSLQHAKLKSRDSELRGVVGLVTGAAGAIGAGICEGLLRAGCLVAVTDLPGEPLDNLVADLDSRFPGRVTGVPMDVTDPDSVAGAFAEVASVWGGVDLAVPNAGVALVSPLTELTLEGYRKLERVNVEGTLLVISEAARTFRRQGTGGDIVLVSTKNVFSPGANFGAYSSTKAAAHQLARIASLEFAGDDVRVNMVAPDAVFSCGDRRSGLWACVGPDRMKARGLDEEGLEDYYRDRNLLKTRVTAEHVANGVIFFATRRTPTTGATIPVDGGLPDSTPR